MKLLYKILFEIKVLHEYYLTNPDNSSVFQDARQSDRLGWLVSRYTKDQPAVSGDLEFILQPGMAELFKNQRLVLIRTFSGFQVAVQVTGPVQSGGTVSYAPLVPMDGRMNILILMRQQGGEFGHLTNGRLRRPIQSLYYFSNEQLTTPKTAPALSNPISPLSAAYTYEQGELVDLGSSIGICYYAGAARLMPPIAGNGFVNENDRLVVGTEFDYTFLASDNVSQATFTLKDKTGATVRSQNVAGQALLGTVTLNFADAGHPTQPALVTLPAAGAADPLLYTLEIVGDGGYSQTVNLIFYDEPADLLSTWGIIQLQTTVTNSDFNLLDAAGNLISKPVLPAPDVSGSPYPVFEIRCKSRYMFWRYYSDDPTQMLKPPTGDLLSFLQATGQTLTTLTPVPATYLPYFFSTNPGAATPTFTYLPNPDPGAVIELDGNQIISDIWVSESGLFATAPTT